MLENLVKRVQLTYFDIIERSQNIDPFQLSVTLKQGALPEVISTRAPNPLTNDTCRRCIFKELHSTVQESLESLSHRVS